MSYVKSSALKWFENIVDNARKKIVLARRKLSLSSILEASMRLGDVVFPRLVYFAEKFASVISRLQVTMIESMISASIWYGLVLLALTILIVILSW